LVELVNRKAKLNLSDKAGCFALDLAAKYGLTEHIEHLVKSGSDLHHKSKNGFEPMHWACANGHATCISKLVHLGASVNSYIVDELEATGQQKLPTFVSNFSSPPRSPCNISRYITGFFR
jgi:ankyrin repeat protein